jgi:hypothetical protein
MKKKSYEVKLKEREGKFDLTGLSNTRRPEYKALTDPNMRHFFENEAIQRYLYNTGQIDSNGRVIDLEKSKSKIAILDKEFAEAEKVEQRRQRDELEMRVSVCIHVVVFLYN